MPKINTNFYNPQTKGRVVYPKEMVEAIRKNTIVLPNGKRISRAELEQGYAANQGTLTDLGGKPSTDTRTSAQRNADYLHPIKGIVERQKSEWDNGKHPVQGLAKTVGASAALATGAAYTSPVVGTWAGLGKNIIAGAIGTIGYLGLEGRTPTKEEYVYGAGAEMLMPLGIKGISGIYGKMFGNKTITPVIKNTIQEVAPVTKNESVYQPTQFQIEKPTTNTLQLKSTMLGSPLEKQLSKDGMLSINSLQAHLNNQSTSMADRTMIQKVLNEKFAGQSKINYNDLRKAVSDEMVPLEKNFDSNYSNYGVGPLGYPGVKKESIEKAIENGKIHLTTFMNNRHFYDNYDNVKSTVKQMRENKKLLSEIPKENTSIVYSNKEKFGRGSTDHFENEGTLGHSRILVSNEEPDVMHILEQQSDYYQKHDVKHNLENMSKNVNNLNELLKDKIKLLEHMKATNTDLQGNAITPIDIQNMEMVIKSQTEANKLSSGSLANYTQKELLGKTHQDRLLQENVAHAAQNGKTKMRYPTPETAAKIQGYKQRDSKLVEKEINELKNNQEFNISKLSPDTKSFITGELNVKIIDFDNNGNGKFIPRKNSDIITDIESKDGFNILKERGNGYSKEHQTILKKYADNPKMIKKLLGVDTRTVTDAKGNSWYEFDIPEAFKKGKAEIKALSTVGAIATGYKAIVEKNKNK